MTIAELRNQLLAAFSRGDAYAFLGQALPYLRQHPADDAIRLAAVSSLARLGLFAPAADLGSELPALLERNAELRQAVETLRRQPDAQLSPETVAAQLAANLEPAAERSASCRQHAEEIRAAAERIELFRCNDGNVLPAVRDAAGVRTWLPAFFDEQAGARNANILPAAGSLLCHPYLIEGCGTGPLIRRVFDGTQQMFLTYQPRIHVVEPNLAQLAAWLGAANWRDLLDSGRVMLWVGPRAVEGLLAWHRAHPDQPPPTCVIRQPGWGPSARPLCSDVPAILAAEVDQAVHSTRERIAAWRPREEAAAFFASRFAQHTQGGLRILGITSRYTTFLQYSMRDIGDAARRAGHEFELLIEPDAHTPVITRPRILARIEQFQPDMILMIDHHRHEYGPTYDFPVPFCNWIQDELPHLFQPGVGERLGPFDLVVGHISRARGQAARYPWSQCRALPIPVNTRVFSADPIGRDELARYACDVSFVSNCSTTAAQHLAETLERTPQPEIRRVLTVFAQQVEAAVTQGRAPVCPAQLNALIDATAREQGVTLPPDFIDHVRRVFADKLLNIHYRQQPLIWAAEMGVDLHLYGRGWENHPQLSRFARGVAQNGRELRCVFQASRINLQMLPTGAIHQRLMEGLASGGFFLMRRSAFDISGGLSQRIAVRVRELGIRSEAELWETADETLARDVRELNGLLYAPGRLYDGFVADLDAAEQRGYRMEAGSLLPEYDRVNFATREHFQQLVAAYLADENARHCIVQRQRECVLRIFTYDAALRRILDFAAEHFAALAAAQPASAAVTV